MRISEHTMCAYNVTFLIILHTVRAQFYIFYNCAVRMHKSLHFLQFYNFITFKLRSTTEQMPALVFLHGSAMPVVPCM
jgi:hypothetical protein